MEISKIEMDINQIERSSEYLQLDRENTKCWRNIYYGIAGLGVTVGGLFLYTFGTLFTGIYEEISLNNLEKE